MSKIVENFRSLIGLAFTLSASCVSAQEETSVPSLDGTALTAWVFKATQLSETGPLTDIVIQRRPVVLALHGCGGLYASSGKLRGQLNLRHQAMGQMLQAQGYHVVFPDSLTARGEKSICVQPIGSRKITQRERRADALGALDWARNQPWADPARVAVLGWSHGGSAVLAATDATHSQVNAKQRLPFATALAFYPGCSDPLAKSYLPNTDLALFLGQDDDWTPPKPCIALAEQLQKDSAQTGKAVELNVYAGAVHDFDTPLQGVRERKEIPSRLHPGKGVMTGQNPAAREASWNRVKEILAKAFQ
jgi:dienelactone hydrolase